MCGIVGVSGAADDAPVEEMVRQVAHRGPDEQGVYRDGDVALAAARLAIVDPDGGAQPMASEDGSVRVVFNGEVYNHGALRGALRGAGHTFATDSDTEVVVHAYEEWGDRFADRIRGPFAAAIWDAEGERLLLARDRFGRRPLYHAPLKDGVAFASEAKALFRHPDITARVDTDALPEYFCFGHVAAPRTMFDGVRKLPPGRTLIHDGGTRTAAHRAADAAAFEGGIDVAADVLRSRLEDAVACRVPAQEDVGVLLSGGVDSGALTALLREAHDGRVRTYTAGLGERFDERDPAARLADRLGTTHTAIDAGPHLLADLPAATHAMDEPVMDPAILPTRRLAAAAADDGVRITYTGSGGDELFHGYEHYGIMKRGSRYGRPVPRRLRVLGARLLRRVPDRVLDRMFPYASALGEDGMDRVERFAASVDDPARAYLALVALFDREERADLLPEPGALRDRVARSIAAPYRIADAARFERATNLPEKLLMKVDRAMMGRGIEPRTPYLDREIAALVDGLPERMTWHRGSGKRVFRRAIADLVPDDTRGRPKQRMFVPVHDWLQEGTWPQDRLLDPARLRRHGFLDADAVGRIRDRFDRSPLYRGRQLWTVATFELWHALYIDDTMPDDPATVQDELGWQA